MSLPPARVTPPGPTPPVRAAESGPLGRLRRHLAFAPRGSVPRPTNRPAGCTRRRILSLRCPLPLPLPTTIVGPSARDRPRRSAPGARGRRRGDLPPGPRLGPVPGGIRRRVAADGHEALRLFHRIPSRPRPARRDAAERPSTAVPAHAGPGPGADHHGHRHATPRSTWCSASSSGLATTSPSPSGCASSSPGCAPSCGGASRVAGTPRRDPPGRRSGSTPVVGRSRSTAAAWSCPARSSTSSPSSCPTPARSSPATVHRPPLVGPGPRGHTDARHPHEAAPAQDRDGPGQPPAPRHRAGGRIPLRGLSATPRRARTLVPCNKGDVVPDFELPTRRGPPAG